MSKQIQIYDVTLSSPRLKRRGFMVDIILWDQKKSFFRHSGPGSGPG